MVTRFFILICFVSFFVFYAAYKKRGLDHYLKMASSDGVEIVKVLPEELSFQSINLTEEISPRDYFPKEKNKLFLHFWATWCAPCEKEFPILEEVISQNFDKFSEVAFVFVAINDKEKELVKFLKKFPKLKEKVLILRDSRNYFNKYLGITKVPETWVFDQSGKLLSRSTGPKEWNLHNLLGL